MGLYLFWVMVAYYILKPVSAAMFLNRFDVTRLPYLYILIALGSGLLAYLYTRVALKASLAVAVRWTMAIAVLCLLALWRLVGPGRPQMLYVFNIWVSLFSVILASQGWLVASHVFQPREAKRLYGLLGLGAVVGAGAGSIVTTWTVRLVGERNLILVCAGVVVLAYIAFHFAAAQQGGSLAGVQAADARNVEFSWNDILGGVRRYRHLQVIVAIILVMFVVDELVDFQFQSVAKAAYQGPRLTAFFGTYYVYLNSVSFFFQLFLTVWVVRTAGVGGTLLINPITIAAVSLGTIAVPGLITAVAARFLEALNRYTFNRTAMELLYLPLPAELRDRTKAFVDIFVDRAGRGIAGLLLLVLVRLGVDDLREVATAALAFAAVWIVLARRAKREYMGTVRGRLERRRLELEDTRAPVGDPAVVSLLEQAAAAGSPRQASYALALLAESPGYHLDPLLARLAASDSPELRSKVYQVARTARSGVVLEAALVEAELSGKAASAAVEYVLTVSPEAERYAARFLCHADPAVAAGAIEALGAQPDLAGRTITREWLRFQAADPDPRRRSLAALAAAAAPASGSGLSGALLEDPEPSVVAAACRAAGRLKDRDLIPALVRRLADPRVRGAAVLALAAYGSRAAGTLGDLLGDVSLPDAVRRQIPRALGRIPDQRTVDALLPFLSHHDLSIRAAVLRALNRLRETAPGLRYGDTFVLERIFDEARAYFLLRAALESLRDAGPRTATRLLARSVEERCEQTLERVFRLMGLKYPSREIRQAWLAVKGGRREQASAALEFLETVLEPQVRRVLLPMLDAPDRVAEHGRELFGLERLGAEAAIRQILHGGDAWLTACAIAAAGESGFRALAQDIVEVAGHAGAEIAVVARDAAATLA